MARTRLSRIEALIAASVSLQARSIYGTDYLRLCASPRTIGTLVVIRHGKPVPAAPVIEADPFNRCADTATNPTESQYEFGIRNGGG